jgi:hypothetical protein
VTSGPSAFIWTRKREGTTAWRESAERWEGVEGAAVQGPRDIAKLRREAICRIPDAVGKNSEGRSWIEWLTSARKGHEGQEHARKAAAVSRRKEQRVTRFARYGESYTA